MLKAFIAPYMPWVYGALAALVIASAAGLYVKGRHDGAAGEKHAEAARLEAVSKAVAKREVQAQAITTKAAADLTAERVKIEYRTRTLIEKVPAYVPQAADDRCSVPRGFVVLHDAAASGSPASLPESAGGSEQAASGVPLSVVAETVISNYGAAFDWRAEALTWRAWYVTQKAAWEKR